MPKVLIVDDDVKVCASFSKILELYGFHTVTETDGNKIVPLLRQEHFDVILLDLLMPSIDGLDLLRQLKQSFENLPVIIVTGYGSIETAVESMQAGAADFVTKPVDASVLNIRIQKAPGEAPGAAPACHSRGVLHGGDGAAPEDVPRSRE